MAYPWPYQIFPTGAVFRKALTTRSGGRSINGSEQVVASGNGYWRASLQAAVYEEDMSLAWQGFHAAVDGRATEILVPAITRYRPRDINGRMLDQHEAVSFGGGALLDHAGLAQTEPVLFTAADTVSLGGTRMIVAHPTVPPMRPGHYFGIGERLHVVARTWALDYEYALTRGGTVSYGDLIVRYGEQVLTYGTAASERLGSNLSVIEFWPRLREDVPQHAPLIAGRPVCKMRLVSDDEGALDQGNGFDGTVSLEFEEVY